MRIGIDIGGTKAHAVAFDDSSHVLVETTLPSGQGDGVLEVARDAVGRLQAEAGRARSLGIGIPGIVDADTGAVLHAVNLGVDRLDLAAGLADLVDGPVRVDNDMNAAALGAFHLVGGSGSLAYLNVGTGLAAGLVLDGKPWRGHRGVVGEVGHIPVDPSGLHCACGQYGCLETVASGGALDRLWRGDVPFGTALAAGDAEATALYTRLVGGVATAAQILVLTAGVADIVLGGGVARHLPLLPDVRAELARRADGSGFLDGLDLPGRVRALPSDVPVPALGAALLPTLTS
jgi:glucokinase